MNKLFTRYLNSAAYFDKPDDQGKPDPKAAAQAERDAIEVVEPKWPGEEEEKEEKKENEEDSDADEEENEEEEKELEPEKEETAEEKTARLAQEKEDRKAARQQRKWDKLAAEKTAAEKRVAELEAKLKEQPVEGLTEEEVERRAEEKAALKRAEEQKADKQKSFEDKCDALDSAASKINKDFSKSLNEMVAEIGPVPGEVINILSDLDNDNGGEVLNYLAENIDDAEDIFELKNNSVKLTLKLARISDKLKAAKEPKPRQRSNVPPPIKPVKESSENDVISGPLTGKEDMDTWITKRNRQAEEHRKRKMGL